VIYAGCTEGMSMLLEINIKNGRIVMISCKEKFLNDFENSTKSKMVVAVKLPTGTEIIVNSDNLDGKVEYYKNAYNDNMELKNNTDIKIVNYMFV